MLHGFDPKLPLDNVSEPRLKYQLVDYSDYKECLVEGLREAHEMAIERNKKETERSEAYYNHKHKTDTKRYPKKGDRVFLKLPQSKAVKTSQINF